MPMVFFGRALKRELNVSTKGASELSAIMIRFGFDLCTMAANRLTVFADRERPEGLVGLARKRARILLSASFCSSDSSISQLLCSFAWIHTWVRL